MKHSPEERKAFVAAQANRMRHEMTPMEAKLWKHLKPLGFQAQVMLCGKTKNGGWWQYIADFLSPNGQVVVEVDGGYHSKRKGRDRRRDTRLRAEDIITLRYKNKDVDKDIENVVAEIEFAAGLI